MYGGRAEGAARPSHSLGLFVSSRLNIRIQNPNDLSCSKSR
jgi:hypothetical protein